MPNYVCTGKYCRQPFYAATAQYCPRCGATARQATRKSGRLRRAAKKSKRKRH